MHLCQLDQFGCICTGNLVVLKADLDDIGYIYFLNERKINMQYNL